MANTATDDDSIDNLLERYLSLLDEYTKLRASLHNLQSSIYQNLARANFSAERGVRYGQDYYDERMQATRKLTVKLASDCPVFEVYQDEQQQQQPPTVDATQDAAKDGEDDKKEEKVKGEEGSKQDSTKEQEEEDEKKTPHQAKSKDPLRWFGLLTPMPLRQAQSHATQAVQDIVPKLVSIDAEMAEVEIKIRRARKKRTKAAAAEEKKQQGGLD
ncbi:hypothetical protein QBC46DRAFT_75712 [Diplogelasinospora grovesii]|uniref:Vacuolar ATPase assembly protein VMA22 n=1 Tax=Diplogelasinospora grovesii TaxID=303347 RepID=A0AAN6NCE1_9PEZI|nr:hypothetical protein QBC46DRAFT_75712 [Diplogelasinospora grovesii]